MAGRALLIGSDFGGLRGPRNDVAAMREILEARGFAVRVCVGPEATRAGILAAYETLIAEVGAGDPAVVYYSGLGGLADGPTGDPAVESTVSDPDLMTMQFILPIDYGESADGDFRGVTSVELSTLLARLTAKTDNAVALFDCCYAAHPSRDPDTRVKAWPTPPRYEAVRAHLDGLGAPGGPDGRIPAAGPGLVRIAACAPLQPAYEHVGEAGLAIGVFTEGLVKALAEAGTAPVAWSTVVERVRRHAAGLSFPQRPEAGAEAEGRVHRLLFGTGEIDPSTPPPLGVPPFPAGVTARGITVRIPKEGPGAASLRTALETVPALRIAGPDEPEWSAEVRIGDDGTLTVRDHAGPLGPPAAADAEGLIGVGNHLRDIAAGVALLRLADGPEAIGSGRTDRPDHPDRSGALGADVDIEWGIVVDGERRPMPDGAVLTTRDRFYLRVHNRHRDPVHVSLVDIGVTGKARLLTAAWPSGREVESGKSWVHGFDDHDGTWDGYELCWPDGVPLDHARPETVLVAVTSAPQDLSALDRHGPAPDLPVPHHVQAVRFALDPAPRAGRFLVEDQADLAAPRWTTRGAAPMTLAVRLDELVVHDNHAMFGRAAVRVDILVATGGAQGGYSARTVRFGNIRDGERLPFERMLMFHGKAEDYLDIAVWVTRDSAGGADLVELMAGELVTADAQQALTDLGAATLGGGGALAVAAVEVGVLVVDIAAKLLHRAAAGGDSIGLYRGSWLEPERFGLGRRPVAGQRQVQDFSIVYTVEEVG